MVGYLGFPGMEGRFVYAADTATAENADNETTAQTRFATASALNSTAPGNTVLASTDALLTPLTTEEAAMPTAALPSTCRPHLPL